VNTITDTLHTHLEQLCQQRQAAGLYRQRVPHHSPQGPVLQQDGRSYLNFCSNDYLGLAAHPALRTALSDACATVGVGAGAAHLVNGHHHYHEVLEQTLAAYTQRPRALLFSTGYMANLGTLTALLDRQDAVFLDKFNHASLVDAARLSRARLYRYPHRDLARLAYLLQHSQARHRLIVTDGVFSMEGDLADLPALAQLAHDHDAWLVVDDAHGLGVLGNTGGGTVEHFGLDSRTVPVLIGTLGKAFGVFGAFVAGSETLIEALIQHARPYIYTTALPPALAATTTQAIHIAIQEPQRRAQLHARIAQLRDGAQALGITLSGSPHTPIQPLILGSNAATLAASAKLHHQGILVTAIRPPTVPIGTARLRITLSAAHQPAHVEQLLVALSSL